MAIIDLDEAVIHYAGFIKSKDKEYITIPLGFVYVRPGAREFFEACFNRFDVVGVYTSSVRFYAESILERLGVRERLDFIACRENTEGLRGGKMWPRSRLIIECSPKT